jgi:DNA-binding GntR family transcriptional regulator
MRRFGTMGDSVDISILTANESADFAHQPIGARIRNVLLRRIIEGEYAPGTRLVELQLAKEFGSSQAPVRDALRELETAGLVTIRPRRGTFVIDYHARAQHEIYEVRGALEEAAMRLAMPKLKADTRALAAHLEGMREAARSHDFDAMVQHSVGFHRAILLAAGNELLLKLWESLHVEIHTRKTTLQPNMDMCAVAESHAPIVAAVETGDTEAACRLSREHQQYFERRA